MDDKQPSHNILATGSDVAETSFLQTLGQNHRRQTFVIAAKVLVSVLIVAYLVYTRRLGTIGIRATWRSPAQVSFALAFLMVLPFVLTLRWQVLLRALEYRLPYRNMLSMTFMVVFFDTIMPGVRPT